MTTPTTMNTQAPDLPDREENEAADHLVNLAGQVSAFITAAKAGNSLRAYRCDWQDFTHWCLAQGKPSLPAAPDTVAFYIADLSARCTASTVTRRLTSIARAHEIAGHPSPATMRHAVVGETLKGIRRVMGTAQKGKLPLLTADLQKLLAHLPDDLGGVRDRALLLVGFAGAFRRSELAGLKLDQVEFTRDGLVIVLGRSKTDQEAEGTRVAVPFGSHHPTCPVRALEKWLDVSRISQGPLFRAVDRHGKISEKGLHPNSIGGMVKRACRAAGYNPREFSGHSLRAGLATQAAANGVSEHLIMRQTRHRSLTTLRRYIREGSLFRENAAAKVGL